MPAIRIRTSSGWQDLAIQGVQGVQGVPGAAGALWRSGTGAPAGALGIVGDWYLNDANGDVYEKTGASTYTLRDNLTGPQGIQGNPGAGAPDATTSSKGSVQLAGDLAGTAAAPQIATGVIVHGDVATANKDGIAATPSMRTLGTGAQQAAPGDRRVATTYTITAGYTKDRAMNPAATTLNETAIVLATLIDDLKAAGLIV